MQEPIDYEPSKSDLVFALLERFANGTAEALHIPSYLTWGAIILVGFWIIFYAMLLFENVIRYIRYALFFLSVMWAIGFILAIQYYAGGL